jgi:hypothetical protein
MVNARKKSKECVGTLQQIRYLIQPYLRRRKTIAELEVNQNTHIVFHRFLDKSSLFLSIREFYKIINHILESCEEAKLDRRLITFSFDDGYKEALPVINFLLEKNFSVKLFVCNNIVTSTLLLKDAIAKTKFREGFPNIIDATARKLTTNRRLNYFLRINRTLMEQMTYREYVELTLQLNDSKDSFVFDGMYISVEDIRRLLTFSHFKIGCHSSYHYKLSNMNDEEIICDLGCNKSLLENTFQTTISEFAIPYGIDNNTNIDLISTLFPCVYNSKKEQCEGAEGREAGDILKYEP